MTTARIILLGILLAQLADAATFAVAVSRFGISLESNGFAVEFYRMAGLEGVLWAKLGVIIAAIALLAATAPRFPRLLVWGGAATTSFGLLGFLTNTASIIILS